MAHDLRTCRVRGCGKRVPAGKLGEHYGTYHRNHLLGKVGLRGHRQMQRSLDSHIKAVNDVGKHLIERDHTDPRKYFPNEDYAQAFHTVIGQARKSQRPTTFLE